MEQASSKGRQLEVGEDLEFQSITWKVQRVGWVVMALTVLAALLGLVGPGPLNDQVIGQPTDALWVEAPRFSRFQAPLELTVHVAVPDPQTDRIRLWVRRRYLEHLDVKQILPDPDRAELAGDRYVFTFSVAAAASRDDVLTFSFEPQRFGTIHGELGLENGPSLKLSHFVYP